MNYWYKQLRPWLILAALVFYLVTVVALLYKGSMMIWDWIV